MRLFIGLELPADVRSSLAVLCAGVPGARWGAAENMHLTLCFIGDVDGRQADELHDDLRTLQFPSFELVLRGIGTFGRGRTLRNVWVGCEPCPPLVHIQKKLVTRLQHLNMPCDSRSFTPHVTLAWFAPDTIASRVQAFVEGNALFQLPAFTVGAISLFSSHPNGHYRVEARYSLLES